MKIASLAWDLKSRKWSVPTLPALDSERTLVLAFGAPELLGQSEAFGELARAYPRSHVIGCSSAGEIHGTSIRDGSLSVSVARFDKTRLETASLEVAQAEDSFVAGQTLASKLVRPDLRAVLVLSEGLKVNGSELVRGLNSVLDESVVVTGGLSGDGTRFERTWVALRDQVKSGLVVAVGFYGDHVMVGHGSKGGWDKFGPERTITRAKGNVLYELDGKPALSLYKEYLGAKASGLPATGLLFPLSLRANASDDKYLVRTLLAVDEQAQSMTFAGDLPQGWLAQLMKADFDKLVEGASLATAMVSSTGAPVGAESLVVAISCVGRRLVLGERTEEEVEAVQDALPKAQKAHITGFYSYGEISPYASGHCDLHNQTMTLTVFSESPTPIARRKEILAAPVVESAPVAPVARAPRSSTRIPAAQSTATGAPTIARRQEGSITVLGIAGRISESFKGEALGRTLQGQVVFDLAAVERVTSFGVREWLHMLSAAQERGAQIHFARASEAVVNQLAMIRKFAGTGRVLSFFAPYLCDGCGEPFERLFDVEDDAEVIRAGRPPEVQCPRCKATGRFDDDAKSYFSFATPHVGAPVTPEIRAVIDALVESAPAPEIEAIDKSVEGSVTRIRLNAKLDASIRWARILDGLEGTLRLDLGGASGFTPEGLASLDAGLRSVATELDVLQIERAPQAWIETTRTLSSPKRPKIVSAVLDGHCPSCAVHRGALVVVDEHLDALRKGGEPSIRCRRCDGPISLSGARKALDLLAKSLEPVVSAPPPSPPPASIPEAVPAVIERRPTSEPRSKATMTWAVVAGVVAIGALAFGMKRQPTPEVTPAPVVAAPPAQSTSAVAAPASAWSTDTDLPPPWVERPLIVDDTQVLVVGRGEVTATAEAAIARARTDAIVRLVRQIHADLEDAPIHAFVQPRIHEDAQLPTEAIAKRFLAQVGAFATPERVDVATRVRPGGVEGFARYKLSKDAYTRALGVYREVASFQGMIVARFFPLLEGALKTDGDLVVVSVQKPSSSDGAGVRAGDVVLQFGTRPVAAIDAFNKTSTAEWNATPPGGTLAVQVEAAGARNVVRYRKPMPPKP